MKLSNEIIEFSKKSENAILILDIDIVEKNYKNLKKNLNRSEIFYAVKANSDERILKRLISLNSSFDVASIGELELLLRLGAKNNKISFGNTIKKSRDIKAAYNKGIKIFVADEFAEIDKISENAANSKVFVRIEMSDSDSDWPLTKKFGCNIDKAKELLLYIKEKNLKPYGISFHVGSQCYDKYIWKTALLKVHDIFESMREHGIELEFINTGGGMPVKHIREIPKIKEICKVINETIDEYFSSYKNLLIAVEPGRSMVGDAGILVSEVILIADKAKNEWIYLDAGVFHGLMETVQDFRYEILIPNRKGKNKRYTLSGPSCDSVDTLYDDIYLADDIEIGDKVFFINAGAYTTGYSTYFNGIEPPKVVYFEDIINK